MQELTQLLDALGVGNGPSSGKLVAFLTWVATLKLAIMPFANIVQAKLAKGLEYVAESPEKDDDALAIRILSSKWYRLFAFLLKWLTSFKLPDLASFNALTKPNP